MDGVTDVLIIISVGGNKGALHGDSSNCFAKRSLSDDLEPNDSEEALSTIDSSCDKAGEEEFDLFEIKHCDDPSSSFSLSNSRKSSSAMLSLAFLDRFLLIDSSLTLIASRRRSSRASDSSAISNVVPSISSSASDTDSWSNPSSRVDSFEMNATHFLRKEGFRLRQMIREAADARAGIYLESLSADRSCEVDKNNPLFVDCRLIMESLKPNCKASSIG